MENIFDNLGLKDELVEGLKKLNITSPTDIQNEVIPLALQNKDIIGQSKTGSGKTLAYLLPIFQKVDTKKRETQALILAPTHELAMQIFKEIEALAKASNVAVTALPIIGEANITRQIEKLKEKPHIIVGSTGRIYELIKKKKISAHTVKSIVIDEADRLLDHNNIESVKAVIKTTLKERQLLAFSATMPVKAVNTTIQMMKEPEIIKIEEKDEVNSDITHYYFLCEQREKIEVLRKLVHALKPERAIVFLNRSDDIEIITSKLKYHKLMVEGIHGSFTKEERKKALEDFRLGKIQLLVASDIAARGLDIKGVTHIFNLDIPEDPKDYLHRVGRTARAGEKGIALSIATQRDLEQLKKFENLYHIKIEYREIYMGKMVESRSKLHKK
jgi:superfamily II DNA/RNA helicase